ncbi:hypothetical protein [Paenibacillus ehimensis]|uniref:Lipoprotein n=1 Tax=Paenibacillus ehimensis TaxID=79264 RepID=A0ABT8VI84_9BACL|nr:hypothetical protein [Paenibacillus ehimensis]MDO3680656.1 hypothetical protein [Paenibacillus ehimensis]
MKKGSLIVVAALALTVSAFSPISSSASAEPTQQAAALESYQYVGTMSGHTQAAKDAAALAATLAGSIPGLGWTAKAITTLTGYGINQSIPAAYYTYDLYQKGFMTENWYQYSVVRFYEDKEHTKPMGQAWTTNPVHIDLPNSVLPLQ